MSLIPDAPTGMSHSSLLNPCSFLSEECTACSKNRRERRGKKKKERTKLM
jgi:hypothetical protein